MKTASLITLALWALIALFIGIKAISNKDKMIEAQIKVISIQRDSIKMLETHNDSLAFKLDWYRGQYYYDYNTLKKEFNSDTIYK